jgi:hypothetical protein
MCTCFWYGGRWFSLIWSAGRIHEASLRGPFVRRNSKAHGLKPVIAQANIASNFKKRTLRGMHFQYPLAAAIRSYIALWGSIKHAKSQNVKITS